MANEIEVAASVARIHMVQAGAGFKIMLFGAGGGVVMTIRAEPSTKDGIRVHLDDAACVAAGLELEEAEG